MSTLQFSTSDLLYFQLVQFDTTDPQLQLKAGFYPDISRGNFPQYPFPSKKCTEATYCKQCFSLLVVDVCVDVCVITSRIQLLPESQ